jgi:hypothetical protein
MFNGMLLIALGNAVSVSAVLLSALPVKEANSHALITKAFVQQQ